MGFPTYSKAKPSGTFHETMKDAEPYTCPELNRNPGLTDDRFKAYRLPSRVGDRLVYPKRDYQS